MDPHNKKLRMCLPWAQPLWDETAPQALRLNILAAVGAPTLAVADRSPLDEKALVSLAVALDVMQTALHTQSGGPVDLAQLVAAARVACGADDMADLIEWSKSDVARGRAAFTWVMAEEIAIAAAGHIDAHRGPHDIAAATARLATATRIIVKEALLRLTRSRVQIAKLI